MFVGYAVSELLNRVWTFESDMKSKDAIERNLTAILDAEFGYSEITEINIYRAESYQGERYEELAEYAARDRIESTPGITAGYALEGPIYVTKIIDPIKSGISELSRDYGIGKKHISELFDSWAGEYGPDFDQFKRFFATPQKHIYE